MPDRYGDQQDLDDWPQVPPPIQAAPDREWAAQQRHEAALEIANCGLCDTDGYTPALRICDHRDHAPAAARGMALIREQMGWKADR